MERSDFANAAQMFILITLLCLSTAMVESAQGQDATWSTADPAKYWWRTETANWLGLAAGDAYPNNTGTTQYDVILPTASKVGVASGPDITLTSLLLQSAGAAGAQLEIYDAGTILDAGNLKNFSGSTLSGGTYVLFGGTLKFDNADIRTLAADTTLHLAGNTAQIQNQSGQNALANFRQPGAI